MAHLTVTMCFLLCSVNSTKRQNVNLVQIESTCSRQNKCDSNCESCSKTNVCFEHCLLYRHCFQKESFLRALKTQGFVKS